MDKINDFKQLEKIVKEIYALPNWREYKKEINALKDEYISMGSDEKERKLRRRRCFSYSFGRNIKEFAQEQKERQIADDKKKDKAIQKAGREKSLITLVSPNSFNYLAPKMPRFTARQDALIDFIFSKIHKDMPKASEGELNLITQENYEMVLADREDFPIALTGFKFTTTDIRRKLGIRYPEKEMIEDFYVIRDTGINAVGKIWADEEGKYSKKARWRGSIISDVVDVKEIRLIPRTGESVHEVHILLGYITGILWINDSVRGKYRLFSIEFYKLPQQCQKIYRYLSLWLESHIDLDKFISILGYGKTKNLTEQKNLIEGYLDVLKKEEFIYNWERAEGTRGLGTQWHIWKESK